MTWVKLPVENGLELIYGRIDDDGLMRLTAVREYPELLEWIEENGEPEEVE